MKYTNNSKRILTCDGHLHLAGREDFAQYLVNHQIVCTINCQNQEEWHLNRSLLGEQRHHQYLSYGIHPWDAAQNSSIVTHLYEACDIIGEVGLDKPWTDVSLTVQLPIFRQQLAIAQQLKKPVILHTKGYEALILDHIREFPNTYYVHWYSSDKYLEEYIAEDVYLSVGPSVISDPSVQQVARLTPSERLLVESDGIEATAWAYDQALSGTDSLTFYQASMVQTIQTVAKLRQSSPDDISSLCHNNLLNFINTSA